MATVPEPGSLPCKIPRHERYCLARMNGMSISDAAKNAGYKGKNPWQIEKQPPVVVRLTWMRMQAADRVIDTNSVTRVEVIQNARDILLAAMKGTDVLDKAGKSTGALKQDLSSANKANETLGKTIGLFVDVTRIETFDEELDGKDPKELEALVLSLLEQLDPNMRKKFLDKVGAGAIDMETIGDGSLLQ